MGQEVTSPLGDGVSVTRRLDGKRLTLVIKVKTDADCVLHWGLNDRAGGSWARPPEASWPAGTAPADGGAVRTLLTAAERGERATTIPFDLPGPARRLVFVLHYPGENRWVKSGGKDFTVPLGGPGGTPTEALAGWNPGENVVRQVFTLDGGEQLAVARGVQADSIQVRMVSDADPPLLLHWGMAGRFRHEWLLPPENYRPAGSVAFDQQAVRTPFTERQGLQHLELAFARPAEGPVPLGMQFILFSGETPLKSGGKDLYLPLFEQPADPRLTSPKLRDLAEQIVGAEKGAASWTLMHRFNLCHDLLDGVDQDPDVLALLFVWLRYSAIRQLDWQRRYNTKPRELSHAQDRLTRRLAGIYRSVGKEQASFGRPPRKKLLRLLLSTLGRGGEGQRVRDEILHIMHRNNLKETSGHFIEEWHQKLHNNTTPDDVVICEAYLAFLRSDGKLQRFQETLKAGGVTPERLKSFERPIKTDPTFLADKKEALIREFEQFLKVLKSVHSGTDLGTAVDAARPWLGEELKKKIQLLVPAGEQLADKGKEKQPRPSWEDQGTAALAARESQKKDLAAAKDDSAMRDLLFLDMALEEFLRGLIERQNLGQLGMDQLARMTGWALRNITLSIDSRELEVCTVHWARLRDSTRPGKDWALHARSVADRAGRWVRGFTDALYQILQPKAEFLGEAFEAERWTVPLFSEEIIRGGPAFALSLLLRPLDRLLRKQAGLGGWQVISPGKARGRVRVVEHLLDVQGERFSEPTVLIADTVSGNEEIPEGVTGIITTDAPDLVSHVAVRARNVPVLFATCFDQSVYDKIKKLQDHGVALNVTPGGDVVVEEAAPGSEKQAAERKAPATHAPAPRRSAARCDDWVVTQEQFTADCVGAKANNLNGLRGRLSGSVRLPKSIALPFGAFEEALATEENRELRRQYEGLLATAEQNPAQVLAQVRARLLEMAPPSGLKESLLKIWQKVGLPAQPWEKTWTAIRRVWASKWNDRAYLSRRTRAVPHDSLLMAVLIQQVVPADYAYVIHTVNPLTGNTGELYAEVVLGLGETLVGNYPGRALGFVCRKRDLSLDLLSYPGKSLGLYGKGVIFRSDSNGEDLEDFAGAGLYDSFLAEEPDHRLLDYREEKLVWDQPFRDELLRSIARVGLEVEKVLDSPQDVEGAVTGGQCYVVQTRPQVGLSKP